MEEKIYDLLEKLYTEVSGLNGRMDSMEVSIGKLESRMDSMEVSIGKLESRMDSLEGKIGNLEGRMGKLELNQEAMNDKLDEAFEAISAHAEIDERQHQEILKELKGEISVVELAVKRIAK